MALWVLLTSSGNRTFTFYLENGKITNIGNGNMIYQYVPSHLRGYWHNSYVSVGLVWTVTIYPAQPLWDSFMTTLPRDLCIAVVAGIVAVTLVYALYDFLTSGRSRALDHIARAANRMLEDVRLVSKAHDFSEELKEINTIQQNAGILDIKAVPPRELDRSSIRTLELLGTGAFGRVYKVSCNHDIIILRFYMILGVQKEMALIGFKFTLHCRLCYKKNHCPDHHRI